MCHASPARQPLRDTESEPAMRPYEPRRPSAGRRVALRGLRLHLREWGAPEAPPLVLLHGSRDASATFQFVVDALAGSWRVIALDWRGHGLSDWAPGGYWWQDYLADLDALLDTLGFAGPVPLAGHSLGGNMALLYAGLRPARIARVISLDGFGLPDRDPAQAPAHLRRWLDSVSGPAPSPVYPSLPALCARLTAANPALDTARALFLGGHLGRERPEGGWTWAFDPAHRRPFATLHRFAETASCWRRIAAPTLFLGSGQPFPPALAGEIEARAALVPGARLLRLPGTGHNLHHDAPEQVAAAIEAFLTG
ncbi:alpha/beta hydrolase fold [Methylobacterium sp. 4-46]|nr:alpha/beta hydrolase fold [Methylobacterium sp. 4-46]